MRLKFKNIRVLIFALIFNFLGGYISSVLSGDLKLIYDSLKKPSFSVPSNLFPIVWGILYLLIAIAVYLNYKNGGRNFISYIFSMLINFSWSIVFFAQRLYGIGFFIILFLIVFSIYLGIKYFKNSKIASFIMFIYIIWLTYAGVLNYFIWMYNEM
ncbi:TspO/MBR family protein [Candidatus Arthromitus sp. SFB-rat-Yit]|uniref:TspO/MBR family protein n=1 Tax=Candidatus Arthromitus sp. SFB-rat-Yit TaxID=1041504 RepID=UPI000227A1E1|nr:TspO/MBR family protein [Candidatus Arthromitus sp. SFB-rat-Yit]BAK80758.1 TspO and MBR like protein [Candidatus Arthromitus sp. SFB-rat-Yit]